jgi:Tol biopolymer transport system component
MRTFILLTIILLSVSGCSTQSGTSGSQSVPHEGAWGLYSLDLATEDVELIYSTSREIHVINLGSQGQKLGFAQKVGGDANENFEIFSIGVNGSNLTQLTSNSSMDVYPSFSPDGTQIAFLSWRGSNLDIYVMDADGSNQQLLYDSGGHDADVHWGSGGRMVFTRDHQIWSIKDDGTDARQVTDPANAGDWDTANLPIGDYDPRFNPAGTRIAFERMDDITQANGGYNIYVINSSGITGEVQLTDTTYSQGFANWSSTGDEIVFMVGAISGAGKYDIYMMNADGTNNRDITPGYFPDEFLCHNAVFSNDDSKVYLIGQWFGD